jgi:aminoglycoside phosphotransferase (APT) family kinase protein
LLHGDFHLRNAIVSRGTGAVIGVLDWELSTLGDRLADIGTMLAYWPEPGEYMGGFEASTLDDFPDRAGLARIYLDQTWWDPHALKYTARAGTVEDRHHRRGRHAPRDGHPAEQGGLRDADRQVDRRIGRGGPRGRRR